MSALYKNVIIISIIVEGRFFCSFGGFSFSKEECFQNFKDQISQPSMDLMAIVPPRLKKMVTRNFIMPPEMPKLPPEMPKLPPGIPKWPPEL